MSLLSLQSDLADRLAVAGENHRVPDDNDDDDSSDTSSNPTTTAGLGSLIVALTEVATELMKSNPPGAGSNCTVGVFGGNGTVQDKKRGLGAHVEVTSGLVEVLIQSKSRVKPDDNDDDDDDGAAAAQASSLSREVRTGVIESLVRILRLYRNACADGQESQTDMSILLPKLVTLLACEDGDHFLELLPAPTIGKLFKTSAQLFGNTVVGCESMKEVLWDLIYPEALETLLLKCDGATFDCLSMVILNCLVNDSERVKVLCTSNTGWRIIVLVLERFEDSNSLTPRSNDWAAMLMQLICKSDHYESLYNGLAQIVSAKDVPRGELCKVSLLKFAWGIITDALEADGNASVELTNSTIKFITERFRLLSYLGHDQNWWADEKNAAPATVLATLIPLLGDYALISDETRTKLGMLRVMEWAIDLLRELRSWPTSAVNQQGAKSSSKVKEVVDFGLSTAYCVTRDVIRLLANMVFRHRASQDELRQREAIPLILENFFNDDNNPFVREWAIVAIRNACEGNLDNQKFIDSIEKNPDGVANTDELMRLGMEVTVDRSTGKLKVKQNQPRPK